MSEICLCVGCTEVAPLWEEFVELHNSGDIDSRTMDRMEELAKSLEAWRWRTR